MKILNVVVVFILFLVQFPGNAFAVDNLWYLKVGYGISGLDSDVQTDNIGDRVTDFQKFDDENGSDLVIGYQFGDRWGVEIGYFDTSNYSSSTDRFFSDAGFGSSNTHTNYNMEIEGVNASLVGKWPVSNAFSFITKIGVFSYDRELAKSGTITSTDIFGGTTVIPFRERDSDGGTKISAAIDVSYRLNNKINLLGGYQIYNNIEEADLDMFLLGMSYQF